MEQPQIISVAVVDAMGSRKGMRAEMAIPVRPYPLRLVGPQIMAIQPKRRGTGD
jgi:hypothetical protein